MADLIRDAAQEMSNKEIQYIQEVLNSAASDWSSPFYGTGSGIVKATLMNPMIQHWMRTGASFSRLRRRRAMWFRKSGLFSSNFSSSMLMSAFRVTEITACSSTP